MHDAEGVAGLLLRRRCRPRSRPRNARLGSCAFPCLTPYRDKRAVVIKCPAREVQSMSEFRKGRWSREEDFGEQISNQSVTAAEWITEPIGAKQKDITAI